MTGESSIPFGNINHNNNLYISIDSTEPDESVKPVADGWSPPMLISCSLLKSGIKLQVSFIMARRKRSRIRSDE